MIFEKEVRKLKLLTEKLDIQGDVTEDEADWIYMFRTVFLMTSVKGGARAGLSDAVCKILEDNFVGPYSYVSGSYNPILEAFLDWYCAINRHICAGKAGNCISTVPYLSNISIDSPMEKNIRDTIRDIISNLPDRYRRFTYIEDEEVSDVWPLIRRERTLSCDTYCRWYSDIMQQLVLSRYGLLNRLSEDKNNIGDNNTKEDVNYLISMAGRVKNGHDVTEDEADDIYLVLKFAQALYVNWKIDCSYYNNPCKENQRIKKKGIDALMKSLANWYKTVYEAVRSGRTGNFTYTLPMNPKYNVGRAKTYIKKALEILPPDYTTLLFTKKKDYIKETPIDCYAFENNSNGTTVRSYRYGGVRRIGIDLDKYIKIPDPENSSDWWEKAVLYNSYQHSCLNKDMKCPALVAKLEYLRRRGILPAGTFITPDSCFVAFDEKDYERYKHVLEIPDREIESLAPESRSWIKEDTFLAMERTIDIVKELAFIKKNRDEYLKEDEWIEIDR